MSFETDWEDSDALTEVKTGLPMTLDEYLARRWSLEQPVSVPGFKWHNLTQRLVNLGEDSAP